MITNTGNAGLVIPRVACNPECHISNCDHGQTPNCTDPDGFVANMDVMRCKSFVRVKTGLGH